jgi:prepilin-type N-terminal cleavage/methylation domain-containing protein
MRTTGYPCGVHCRRGFTLVEMLVVMVVIIILTTLVLALAPRFAENQKVAKGADNLQAWLLIAKSRARRDQIPTGVRLTTDTTTFPGHTVVRDLQYIQQPDDYNGGQITVAPARGGGAVATGSNGADFFGGYPTDPALWPVQPFDFLEVKGGGLVHRITAVQQTSLQLETAPPYPIQQPTVDYRIIRTPRVLTGENPLQMAQDIGIDLSPNPRIPRATLSRGVGQKSKGVQNFADILFAPGGGLIERGAPGDSVILWVHNLTLDDPYQGEPVLITIYSKTGFIAAHPVAISGPDPYAFTTDGRSSGL